MAKVLVELIATADIFCSGLGKIELLSGGMARHHLYVEQTREDGEIEKVVVAKIVAPLSAMYDAMQQMMVIMATSPMTSDGVFDIVESVLRVQ